jgi:hypothetical protein
MDPMTVMAAGTALARAGITNTKSGTWLREMMTRSMPGTVMMSKTARERHHEAELALGLVDANDKPTFFTDGKPDMFKMLNIAAEHAGKIPLEKLAGYERAIFGAQGSGAFSVLADPKVAEQMRLMQAEMQNPENINRVRNFQTVYGEQSTLQNSRQTFQTFNVLMADLGDKILPSVNNALGNFKSILEGIRNVLPGGDGKSAAVVGGHAIVGAAGGALTGLAIGALGGPIGMAGGALIGGVVGGAEGVAEQYMRGMNTGQVVTGNSVAQTVEAVHSLAAAIRGAPGGPGGVFAGGTARAPAPTPQISLSLNVDGARLGQAISKSYGGAFNGQAPAFDAMGAFVGGDAQHGDK